MAKDPDKTNLKSLAVIKKMGFEPKEKLPPQPQFGGLGNEIIPGENGRGIQEDGSPIGRDDGGDLST